MKRFGRVHLKTPIKGCDDVFTQKGATIEHIGTDMAGYVLIVVIIPDFWGTEMVVPYDNIAGLEFPFEVEDTK